MDEEKEFDEIDALQFIRSNVDEQVSKKYDDDDLLIVLDIMFEFDEKCGDSDIDNYDEQVIKYVIAQLHKDPENRVEDADVPQIVTAELDYEDSLAM